MELSLKNHVQINLKTSHKWTNGLKTLKDHEFMMTHGPNGPGQYTLNQIFMDQECLVNHEGNRLQCTMKHEMIDHEPRNLNAPKT